MSEAFCRHHAGRDIEWNCAICGIPLCRDCEAVVWEGETFCSACLPLKEGQVRRRKALERLHGILVRAGRGFLVLLGLWGTYQGCIALDNINLERRYRSPRPLAPNFVVKDLEGKQYSLKALRGKVVILDFWASWCAPCVRLIPDINRLYEEFKDQDLVLLGINRDQNVTFLRDAITEHHIAYPQVWDLSGQHFEVLKSYGVEGFPTTIIIDKEGKIFKRWGQMDRKMSHFARFLLER